MILKYNQLKFEAKVLTKDEDLNQDRSYIDFIVDGKSLANYLGNIDDLIAPFGWGYNKTYELECAQRLISFGKSAFDNGLHSAYVCAYCGDEGCGAVMFDVINHVSYVEWTDFVYSDGYPTEYEPDEKVNTVSFRFEIGKYQQAINQLQGMINRSTKR